MRLLIVLVVAACILSLLDETSSSAAKRRSKRVSRPSRLWYRRNKRLPSITRRINLNRRDFVKIDSRIAQVKAPKDEPEKKPKEIKKNEYYIDPVLLKKMDQVKSMKDFIRIFKPKGYSIQKELIDDVKTGSKPLQGRRPDPIEPIIKPKFKDVIYFKSRKVSEEAKDTVPLSCGLKYRNHRIKSKVGAYHFPNCINLKKCAGCCKESQECVATATRNKTVLVFVSHQLGFDQQYMQFPEDSACKCACIVKKSDCFPKQTYSATNCQCECNLTPQACSSGKHWSRGECGCICSNRRTCKSRLRTWDENSCRCNCITAPCQAGQVRNKESCRCVDSLGAFGTRMLAKTKSLQRKTTSDATKTTWGLSSIDDIFSDDNNQDGEDTRDDEEEDF